MERAGAGDFAGGEAEVIGVLIRSTSTMVAALVSAGQRVATSQQFPLVVSTSGFGPQLEREHLHQCMQRGVAGVLVIGHLRENLPRVREIQERGIPCVFLWDVLPGTTDNYVGFDNVQGSYAMVDFLISQGHRRIGFICGINAGVDRITKRYEGYQKALEANGLGLDTSLVRSATSTYAKGKAAMQELMTLPDPPRCVCCASDVIAMGAISAVTEAGYNVPHYFCVVGFDNSDFSAYTCPPLSTVDVPGVEMGKLGMEALMRLINDEHHHPVQTELPTSLVLRKSCCPADRMNKW